MKARILFTLQYCLGIVVQALGSTCCGTVLKVFRKCDRPNIYGKNMVNIRPRYPKYRSKISIRYEGSGGLIGIEGAKGI